MTAVVLGLVALLATQLIPARQPRHRADTGWLQLVRGGAR